jgi:hypothetical protein
MAWGIVMAVWSLVGMLVLLLLECGTGREAAGSHDDGRYGECYPDTVGMAKAA